MLLTEEEQAELGDLHAQAVASSLAPNKPVLWHLKLKEKSRRKKSVMTNKFENGGTVPPFTATRSVTGLSKQGESK
jgi:hypothetical protein